MELRELISRAAGDCIGSYVGPDRDLDEALADAILALLDSLAIEAQEAVKRLAGALELIHVEQTDWQIKRDALDDSVVRRIVEGG